MAPSEPLLEPQTLPPWSFSPAARQAAARRASTSPPARPPADAALTAMGNGVLGIVSGDSHVLHLNDKGTLDTPVLHVFQELAGHLFNERALVAAEAVRGEGLEGSLLAQLDNACAVLDGVCDVVDIVATVAKVLDLLATVASVAPPAAPLALSVRLPLATVSAVLPVVSLALRAATLALAGARLEVSALRTVWAHLVGDPAAASLGDALVKDFLDMQMALVEFGFAAVSAKGAFATAGAAGGAGAATVQDVATASASSVQPVAGALVHSAEGAARVSLPRAAGTVILDAGKKMASDTLKGIPGSLRGMAIKGAIRGAEALHEATRLPPSPATLTGPVVDFLQAEASRPRALPPSLAAVTSLARDLGTPLPVEGTTVDKVSALRDQRGLIRSSDSRLKQEEEGCAARAKTELQMASAWEEKAQALEEGAQGAAAQGTAAQSLGVHALEGAEGARSGASALDAAGKATASVGAKAQNPPPPLLDPESERIPDLARPVWRSMAAQVNGLVGGISTRITSLVLGVASGGGETSTAASVLTQGVETAASRGEGMQEEGVQALATAEQVRQEAARARQEAAWARERARTAEAGASALAEKRQALEEEDGRLEALEQEALLALETQAQEDEQALDPSLLGEAMGEVEALAAEISSSLWEGATKLRDSVQDAVSQMIDTPGPAQVAARDLWKAAGAMVEVTVSALEAEGARATGLPLETWFQRQDAALALVGVADSLRSLEKQGEEALAHLGEDVQKELCRWYDEIRGGSSPPKEASSASLPASSAASPASGEGSSPGNPPG